MLNKPKVNCNNFHVFAVISFLILNNNVQLMGSRTSEQQYALAFTDTDLIGDF